MADYISSTMFEIVKGAFIYRGWDVRGDHKYKAETPQLLHFGETGILLLLFNGDPKLLIPDGKKAELLVQDYAFKDGKRVYGKFVEVRIY